MEPRGLVSHAVGSLGRSVITPLHFSTRIVRQLSGNRKTADRAKRDGSEWFDCLRMTRRTFMIESGESADLGFDQPPPPPSVRPALA